MYIDTINRYEFMYAEKEGHYEWKRKTPEFFIFHKKFSYFLHIFPLFIFIMETFILAYLSIWVLSFLGEKPLIYFFFCKSTFL